MISLLCMKSRSWITGVKKIERGSLPLKLENRDFNSGNRYLRSLGDNSDSSIILVESQRKLTEKGLTKLARPRLLSCVTCAAALVTAQASPGVNSLGTTLVTFDTWLYWEPLRSGPFPPSSASYKKQFNLILRSFNTFRKIANSTKCHLLWRHESLLLSEWINSSPVIWTHAENRTLFARRPLVSQIKLDFSNFEFNLRCVLQLSPTSKGPSFIRQYDFWSQGPGNFKSQENR